MLRLTYKYHSVIFRYDSTFKQTRKFSCGIRNRHTVHDITCPSMSCMGGVYPNLSWQGGNQSCPGWGVTHPVLALGVSHPVLARGYPILSWLGGMPCWGLGSVTGVPSRRDMGPVEVLWDGDRVPPPVNRQDE